MTWPPWMDEIATLLTREAGLAFGASNRPHAQAAARRAMEKARCRSTDEYLAQLQRDPRSLQALIDEIVVGETYFFRDPAQWDVVAERLPNDAPVRVWSAGCSSGEEAYTFAILLDDRGFGERGRVVGSDISSTALDRARRGVYGSWSFRTRPPRSYGDAFIPRKDGWSVTPRLRSRVEFVEQNLLRYRPGTLGPPFDVIMCRNVLLYFERDVIARVVAALAASLRPGGWLVTSAADPLLTEVEGLEAIATPAGVIYRRGGVARPAVAPAVHVEMPERARPFELVQPSIPAATPLPVTALPPASLPAPPVEPAPAEELMQPNRHVVEAFSLLEANRPEEAAVSARRALFLDRSLAAAHFALARALRMLGCHQAARRSLMRAGALLADVPPDEPIACADGVTAQTLARSAGAEFALLDRSVRR